MYKRQVYIGQGVKIKNAVIGPYVSIETGSVIEHSVIDNSIVLQQSVVKRATLTNSLIGSHVQYSGVNTELSLGDYSTQN